MDQGETAVSRTEGTGLVTEYLLLCAKDRSCTLVQLLWLKKLTVAVGQQQPPALPRQCAAVLHQLDRMRRAINHAVRHQ